MVSIIWWWCTVLYVYNGRPRSDKTLMCEPKYLMLPWGIQSIPVYHRQGIMMAVFYYIMNALFPFLYT